MIFLSKMHNAHLHLLAGFVWFGLQNIYLVTFEKQAVRIMTKGTTHACFTTTQIKDRI